MRELAMQVWTGGVPLEVVRATLLLVLVFCAVSALRRTSAATRHLLWAGGVVALLSLPVLSALTPWRWDPAGAGAPASITHEPARSALTTAAAPRLQTEQERPAPRILPSESTERAQAGFDRADMMMLLFGLWAAGVAVAVLRLVAGVWSVRGMARRAQPLHGSAWTRPLFEAADRLGLPDAPRLLISESAAMPFVAGVMRPAVVLPAAAHAWSEERRRAVLLHELAHIRRGDVAVNLVGRLAGAIWWFHPLVRVAVKRMRLESERACDDLVLHVGTLPSSYADHLLQIVRGAGRSRTPVVALPMAQRTEFEGRMLAILEPNAARGPARRLHAALVCLIAVLITVPLATLGPARVQAAAPPLTQTQPERDASLQPEPASEEPVAAESNDTASEDAGEAPEERLPEPAPQPDEDVVEGDHDAGSGRALPLGWLVDDVQTQDTTVVQALRAALNDPSAEVREVAAGALGDMQATVAIPDLTAIVRTDASADVREVAVWALAQLNGTSAQADIARLLQSDANADVRSMAAWALGQFGAADAVPALVAALSDANADVRATAAWALGTIHPTGAPPELIRALDDEVGEVREHAAWALGQIGDPAAVDGLMRRMADEDAGAAAIWAIGNMDMEAARPALIEVLRNGSESARAAAARALSGRGNHPWPWPWPRPRH